jgi:2-C-methyl-D-erythritol 4-phosphate cytidylyltransferase
MHMQRYAIIVAAGTGSRMNSGLPKQFLLLAGKPVLYYSLKAFFENDTSTIQVVVLAKQEVTFWKEMCQKHKIQIPHQIVIGGNTRNESVRNGLNFLSGEGIVAIHDGARPFVNNEIIENCFLSAEKNGSGVACVKVKDSVRLVKESGNSALERDSLRLMQTPQTFQLSLIKKAFERLGDSNSTDDATVAEKAGHEIHLVEGSYQNLKITTPEDLILASALLN